MPAPNFTHAEGVDFFEVHSSMLGQMERAEFI